MMLKETHLTYNIYYTDEENARILYILQIIHYTIN